MNELARVTIEKHDEVVVARVVGEIDLSNAERIFEEVLDAVVGQTRRGLAVDLSETSYIDSAGIRSLFEVSGRLEALGCRVRCVVPEDSALRRVMKLAEVERALALDPTREQALEALR